MEDDTMKKGISVLLTSVLLVGMLSTSAFAAYDEAYKTIHPNITEAQYNYGTKIMSQIKPNVDKLKQGIFEITLPKINSNYEYSLHHGLKFISINKYGGQTVTLKFDASKKDTFMLSLTTKEWDVILDNFYDWDPNQKGFLPYSYEQEAIKLHKETLEARGQVPLIDISKHWAKADIENAVRLGFIKGYPDLTFKPNNNITRAEFTTALVRALKLSESSKASIFTDDNSWAEPFIQSAIEKGIVKPEEYPNNKFEPNKLITRQEIAIMTVRALDMEQKATDKGILSTLISKLTDLAEIDEKWRGYIKVANDLGIIRGYLDGSFGPHKNATRAEAVVMVLRTIEQSKN